MASKSAQRSLTLSRKRLRDFLKDAVFEIGKINEPEAIVYIYEAVARRLSYRKVEEEIITLVTNAFGQYEFRLNKAGFKLYVSVLNDGTVEAFIGGDQTVDHLDSFAILTMLLRKHGLLADYRRNCWPMAEDFFEKYWESLKPLTRKFVRSHFELLPCEVKKF